MARLRDIHIFLKLADKMADKLECDPSYNRPMPHYPYAAPVLDDVKSKFAKPNFLFIFPRNKKRVNMTFDAARDGDYIGYEDVDGVRYMTITGRVGRNMLEQSFFNLLPKGLFLAWAEKNHSLYSLIIGFVGGVIIGAAGVIATVMGIILD